VILYFRKLGWAPAFFIHAHSFIVIGWVARSASEQSAEEKVAGLVGIFDICRIFAEDQVCLVGAA
jgi:hypothetical protein